MIFKLTYFVLDASSPRALPIAREFMTDAPDRETARAELHRKLNEWNYQSTFAAKDRPRFMHWTEDL